MKILLDVDEVCWFLDCSKATLTTERLIGRCPEPHWTVKRRQYWDFDKINTADTRIFYLKKEYGDMLATLFEEFINKRLELGELK